MANTPVGLIWETIGRYSWEMLGRYWGVEILGRGVRSEELLQSHFYLRCLQFRTVCRVEIVSRPSSNLRSSHLLYFQHGRSEPCAFSFTNGACIKSNDCPDPVSFPSVVSVFEQRPRKLSIVQISGEPAMRLVA
jgi:hypothetical protein